MKKIRIIELSVAFGLLFSIVFSVVSFGASCDNIRNNVIRLHVLANSDSEEDQAVKLVVRDELLKSGNELFSGNLSFGNAYECIDENKDELKTYINSILENKGFGYKSEIYLVEEYFNTRTYEDFTLPAGEYLAVKVVLGNGAGHNWWCVMFPPLCLPAAADKIDLDMIFNNDCKEIVKSSPDFEIRFKIVEIIERLKHRI